MFDTQVAAGFAGSGPRPATAACSTTCSACAWPSRPASPAGTTGRSAPSSSPTPATTSPTLRLADALQERLAATGRLQWAREECRRLEESSDERDPWLAWQRLPRIGQLNPRARAVARELAAWREQTAAAEDRPVSSVLGDAPWSRWPSGARRRRPWSASAASALDPAPPRRRDRGRGRPRAGRRAAARRGGRAARLQPGRRARHRPVGGPGPARALDAGLAYELVAARNDLAQVVAAVRRASPSRRSAPSRAGAATWSAASSWCWPGAAPWPSTAPAASRSAAASRPGRRRACRRRSGRGGGRRTPARPSRAAGKA